MLVTEEESMQVYKVFIVETRILAENIFGLNIYASIIVLKIVTLKSLIILKFKENI